MNNIDILERVCECRRFSGVFTDVGCIFKAIETLIAENKELKEEIEELKNGQIDFWISDKEIEERRRNKFVSNDKIKAKIEECRKILYSFEKELELKANKDQFIHKESMNCLLGQISILQSLLEKE